MKKLLSIAGLTGMFSLILAPMNINAAGYGLAGCGLGAMLIGPAPGVMQVFAATSNATFGSQTFGITTGTSECGGGAISQEIEQRFYMANNLDAVKNEAAAGQGERLSNLAYLMGCSADSVDTFSSVAQKNYDKIFDANAEQAPEYVLHRLKTTVKNDAVLTTSCKKVWL